VDRKFANLAELEKRAWQEPDIRPVLKKAAVQPRKPAAAKKPAASGIIQNKKKVH
jgi:hypothetical protein